MPDTKVVFHPHQTHTSETMMWWNAPISSSGDAVILGPQEKKQTPLPPRKEVVDAVYGHIRALKALGKTSVTAAEVAIALQIDERDANKALKELHSRGVKPQK